LDFLSVSGSIESLVFTSANESLVCISTRESLVYDGPLLIHTFITMAIARSQAAADNGAGKTNSKSSGKSWV